MSVCPLQNDPTFSKPHSSDLGWKDKRLTESQENIYIPNLPQRHTFFFFFFLTLESFGLLHSAIPDNE